LWAEVPTVANPLLKFMEELVTNKNSRVTFENVSPNGILLFKETSRILVTYGTRALAQPLPHVR
jgi:exportin-7